MRSRHARARHLPRHRSVIAELLERRRLLAATVYTDSQHLPTLHIPAADTVTINPHGDHFIHTDDLSIAAGGKLDLNDNDLIVTYTGSSPYTQIRDWVESGYSAIPDAAKSGITSTLGQNSNGATVLALFDNASLGATEWPLGSGNAVPDTAVIGKYTWIGDVNLDGKVTPDDYVAIDSNINTTPEPGLAWLCGDLNADPTSPTFYPLTVALAATWVIGGFASGPLPSIVRIVPSPVNTSPVPAAAAPWYFSSVSM